MAISTFRNLALLIFTISLAGCQTTSAGVTYDKHTGESVTRATTVNIHSGLLSALYATPMYSNKNGYQIFINYNNTGIGWQFFNEAWSNGTQYKFIPTTRETALCTSTGCSIIEQGFIKLSEGDFKKFSKQGLEFKLVGQKGSIEGNIAAASFQEVLDLKSTEDKKIQ